MRLEAHLPPLPPLLGDKRGFQRSGKAPPAHHPSQMSLETPQSGSCREPAKQRTLAEPPSGLRDEEPMAACPPVNA